MLTVKSLGLVPYLDAWKEMKAFTDTRTKDTPDEIWLLQHPPVYTQGQAGKPEHVLNPHQIPVVQSDRGGQVTYHGPGQLVAYFLMDIKRRNVGIRTFVCQLEKLLIALLAEYDIKAEIKQGAPGVYVDQQKIASIGLRVRKGCTYHGIALNVCMDLEPFKGINPCGYKALDMTQISLYNKNISFEQVQQRFQAFCLDYFLQDN